MCFVTFVCCHNVLWEWIEDIRCKECHLHPGLKLHGFGEMTANCEGNDEAPAKGTDSTSYNAFSSSANDTQFTQNFHDLLLHRCYLKGASFCGDLVSWSNEIEKFIKVTALAAVYCCSHFKYFTLVHVMALLLPDTILEEHMHILVFTASGSS